MPLLEVTNLVTRLDTKFGRVDVVDGVTLDLDAGEMVGLVGESGSGKTLMALSLMRLVPDPPGRVVGGEVRLDGRDTRGLNDEEFRRILGNDMAIVFQDPMTTLNPLLRIGTQISESIEEHLGLKHSEARQRSVDLLKLVGIPGPEKRIHAYPHELSGGMRQRISIAMALACKPKLLIADEVTTALDVTIQSQVLELLQELSRELGMSVLLITHDLGIVAGMTQRVNVMYAGQIVEQADTTELFENPLMPYTWGLLGSLPRLDRRRSDVLVPIEGMPPEPGSLPPGCRFEPRCPYRRDICREKKPELINIGTSRLHTTRCWGMQNVPGGGWLTEVGSPIPPSLIVVGENQRPSASGPMTAPVSTGEPSANGKRTGEPSVAERDGAADPSLRVRDPLVEVRGLKVHFSSRQAFSLGRPASVIRAVDGVDLSLRRGETLGLVGESGSGKTTTGRAILQLRDVTEGSVKLDGVELTDLKGGDLRRARRRMQMVFQDPYSSLDRRMTISRIVKEPLEVHQLGSARQNAARAEELLELVGIDPRSANRYPHEFSGGQRQRIAIARALALEPDLIVADEPLSALDMSIQAQVVNLLQRLQREFNLTYLVVAHDLAVVRYMSDQVAVMYLGKIIELAECDELYERALHPYTKALLSAAPIPDPKVEVTRQRIVLRSDIPDPAAPPTGCHFHTRCQLRVELGNPDVCTSVEPLLIERHRAHWAACHFIDELGEQTPVRSSSVGAQ